MSKVNPYPHYSDFDQVWLGDLPLHWQVMRTKLLFDLVTEFAPVGNSEELLSVYTAIGVKPRKELEARGNKASSTDNYWRVQEGDIIVNKLLAWMGAIGISEYNGVTSPAYDILRPKENVNPYYYNFLFRNPISSREFKRHSRGIMDMRLRLYFTRFGDIKLPLPPMKEQDKIVEYLQFKLKKIDRFIRKKKQLIKLLNEQKAAIINKAVTKGLNPKVKMKPSGIEWLGSIPEHWEVKRLKYCCSKITDGSHFSPETKPDGIPYITVTDIGDNTIDLIFSKKISENDYLDLKKNGCQPNINDILLTKDGTIGRAAVVSFNSKFVILSSLGLLTPLKDVFPNYLRNYLVSDICVKEMKSKIQGSALTRLTISLIKNINIIIPPSIKEQQQIVDFIEDESLIINKTIATIEKEIALTQEYRTALIADAVTGKIDVRDFAIPEEKEAETYEDLEEELNLAAEDQAEYEIMEEN